MILFENKNDAFGDASKKSTKQNIYWHKGCLLFWIIWMTNECANIINEYRVATLWKETLLHNMTNYICTVLINLLLLQLALQKY